MMREKKIIRSYRNVLLLLLDFLKNWHISMADSAKDRQVLTVTNRYVYE